jgi:hypothetical protein
MDERGKGRLHERWESMAEREMGANDWVRKGSIWLDGREETNAASEVGANGWMRAGANNRMREGSIWLGERGEPMTGLE